MGQAAHHGKMVRFRGSERLFHWAIAVPFLVCGLSAPMLLALAGSDPPHPLRPAVARVHWVSGLGLIVLPVLAVLVHWRDASVHVRNLREAWVWSLDDVRWLARAPLAALGRDVALPEAGKFNAGEKLNFMVTSLATVLFCVTGLAIEAADDAMVAWLVHVFLAIATAPIVVGHIIMATIVTTTRRGLMGIVTGFVERRWAKHHYSRWYREELSAPHGGKQAASSRRTRSFESLVRASGAVSPGFLLLLGFALALIVFVGNFVPLPSWR